MTDITPECLTNHLLAPVPPTWNLLPTGTKTPHLAMTLLLQRSASPILSRLLNVLNLGCAESPPLKITGGGPLPPESLNPPKILLKLWNMTLRDVLLPAGLIDISYTFPVGTVV